MKNISILALAFLFFSCGNNIKLEKEDAAKVIRAENKYPRVFEHDVYTADPASAKQLLDAGMEEAGIVTIDKTQQLKDIGKPIIHFTEKAKPYLIRFDPKYDIQVVKLADIDLGEVTGIQLLNDQKRANVEYTIVYKNITPFAKLINRDLGKPETKRISLSLFDSGWKVDKNAF